MAKWKREVLLVMILLLSISTVVPKGVTEAREMRHRKRHSVPGALAIMNGTGSNEAYCLSWRMAVEANNMRGWRTIPTQCLRHVQGYMVGGQYSRDISLIIDQIYAYLEGIAPLGDDFDAWIFDVDDTCLSNLFYYQAKRFGCDPYNPTEFKSWASKGESPAIPAVLGLFNRLVEVGFKVILLTGRDEETLGEATVDNLVNQGFIGYERLIMRSPEYRGQLASIFKSEIRQQLMEQGYRLWGNVGDQWSDLQGNFTGGVMMASQDGKIVCENTLDARLDVAFRQKYLRYASTFSDKVHIDVLVKDCYIRPSNGLDIYQVVSS